MNTTIQQPPGVSTAQFHALLKEGSEMAWLSGENLVNCSKCQGQVCEMNYKFNSGLCDECFTSSKKKEYSKSLEKSSMESRTKKWDEICPELYRTSPTEFIDKGNFKTVTNWMYGSNGLMLSGSSRTGKTTSCWHLLFKLYVLQAKTLFAVSEPEFSILREKHVRTYSVDVFLNKCLNCDIFFLDDIGHAATTAKHMEELYFIVEKRTSWKKPIICTTQFSINEIEERSGRSGTSKTAMAILNRLKCFCKIINY